MTPDELHDLFANLRVGHARGRPAPHKPLLALWAIGRCLRNEARLAPYDEIARQLGDLLRRFDTPRKRVSPDLPFWRLQHDGVWEVPEADRITRTTGGNAHIASLRREGAQGGFPEDVFLAFRHDKVLALDIAYSLLDAHFPDTLHEEILRAVGIDTGHAEPAASDSRGKIRQGTAQDFEQVLRRSRDPAFSRALLDADGERRAATARTQYPAVSFPRPMGRRKFIGALDTVLERSMRMAAVISSLRSFVASLWPFARAPASSADPNVPHPTPEPLPAAPGGGVPVPEPPQAGDTPPGDPPGDGLRDGKPHPHPQTVEEPESGGSGGTAEDATGAAPAVDRERKPRQVGGRRGQSPSKQGPERRQSPSSRPDLLCRKIPASACWEVVLTADEDTRITAAPPDGAPLDLIGGRCRIPSLTGRLAVFSRDGEENTVPLFEDEPLIFKLPKNWAGEGRRISRITRGHFIVIAPIEWQRTGHTPVEADGCADPAFRAHYFGNYILDYMPMMAAMAWLTLSAASSISRSPRWA